MTVKIVAELSANHNHDINIAKETIRVSKEAGADAVKLQTYTPETLTIDSDNEFFKITQGTIWDGTTLYRLYQQAYTPLEWHRELFEFAEEIGIEIFSTPFDKITVDFLEGMNTGTYKIASFEITDIPFIEYVASKYKPVIISTGIATFEEINDAVEACKKCGNTDVTLLQCTSQYPSLKEDANLLTMLDLKAKFGTKVGISDHTIGDEVAVVAASIGATIIEKHIILDKKIGGPDAEFSMTPDEFNEMVNKVRCVEKILGKVTYEITEQKSKSRVFARSLFVVEDVNEGEVITDKNVRSIRPGHGISPKYQNVILGKKFLHDVQKGTPLNWEMISK